MRFFVYSLGMPFPDAYNLQCVIDFWEYPKAHVGACWTTFGVPVVGSVVGDETNRYAIKPTITKQYFRCLSMYVRMGLFLDRLRETNKFDTVLNRF